MKKKPSKGYFALLATLLLLISLPQSVTETIRETSIALLRPVGEHLGWVRHPSKESFQQQIDCLQLENRQLCSEIESLQSILHQQTLQRDLVEKPLPALPAKVIFRSPGTWNSCLWLNVGSCDRSSSNAPLVTENSPVMVGTSVVGVIDYVGAHQSRVRLITDSGLNPSVRVVRGKKHNLNLLEHVHALMRELPEGELKMQLANYERRLKEGKENIYLAKGELAGSSSPLWRMQGKVLKGTGFNCDFSDPLSLLRDLSSGSPVGAPLHQEPIALIREHDLLVTTGMDGVFPPGLNVAKVISVNPLKEGDYFYTIEALPTADNLDEITEVLVLPPIGFDSSEKPPVLGW